MVLSLEPADFRDELEREISIVPMRTVSEMHWFQFVAWRAREKSQREDSKIWSNWKSGFDLKLFEWAKNEQVRLYSTRPGGSAGEAVRPETNMDCALR